MRYKSRWLALPMVAAMYAAAAAMYAAVSLGLTLTAACGKVQGAPPAIDAGVLRTGAPPPTVPACLEFYQANEVRTRSAAEFYLGRPVLCGKGGTNGTTCLDTLGGVVWCPITPQEPCVVRGAPPAVLAKPAPAERE